MKHQLFRKNKYVEIDTGRSHLTVVGKVKDSTIVIHRIKAEDTFNVPQQALELEPKLLLIYEDPEKETEFYDDIVFIKEILENLNSLVVKEDKVYASIFDLSIPAEEVKQLFYSFKKGSNTYK